jgi:hypothetical protein
MILKLNSTTNENKEKKKKKWEKERSEKEQHQDIETLYPPPRKWYTSNLRASWRKREEAREKKCIYIYIYIHYLSQHLTVHCVKKQRNREKEHKEISTHIRQVIPTVDNPFFFSILFECSISFGQNKTINKNTFDRFVFINYNWLIQINKND